MTYFNIVFILGRSREGGGGGGGQGAINRLWGRVAHVQFHYLEYGDPKL